MLIPGWDVVSEDGLLVARLCGELTDYQCRYGAVREVDSRDQDELMILAFAQSDLAKKLAQAEKIYESRRRRIGLRPVPDHPHP